MQLLCEGHYLEMQDFLRIQKIKDNILVKNLNLINWTAVRFGQIIQFVNIESISLANQILDFLIEVIQGPCRLNQKSLTNAKIILFIKVNIN